ncbi:MAG: hypothetical protein ACO1OX_07645 [Novosphingobium sp.]
MPRNAPTPAQRFRAAREAFELAMQMGCLPAQARETRRREEAERQWKESGERLRAAMNRPLRRAAAEPAPEIIAETPGSSLVEAPLTMPEAPRRWWLD